MSEFAATGTEITSPLNSIEPLQPQLNREKPQKVVSGWQKLLLNAEKVNQLSEQLEAALFELKLTAREIKGEQKAQPLSNSLFKQKLIVIPYIQYKRPGVLAIASRKVDFFQQEREALQVAQMLRRRTKRRLKRPIPTTLAKSSSVQCQKTGFVFQLVSTWQNLKIALGRKSSARGSTRVSKAKAISSFIYLN